MFTRLVVCLALAISPLPIIAETSGSGAGEALMPKSIPNTRWRNIDGSDEWTLAALEALRNHGTTMVQTVPQDIDQWCPAYREADDAQRRAFWVGFLSALAFHESTHRPRAVGGGGKWYGLLQILPATARGYGCRARTGEALKDGADNLSCAVRIMDVTVPRDNAIAFANGKRAGVAADWGPMVSKRKREQMQAWTLAQPYCQPLSSKKPKWRPFRVKDDS